MMAHNDTHDENMTVPEDEIISSDTEIESAEFEENIQAKLKKLRSDLQSCNEEKREHLEELQRARADFLNSRRRLEEQLARDKERATDKILFELLTLVDSFDTAMADTALWDTIDSKWRVGVEAIHTKLLSILRSNNVTPLDPTGQQFNPEEHEAVSNQTVDDDAQVETVLTVLQKGFKRNDTVIRPARVVVGTK